MKQYRLYIFLGIIYIVLIFWSGATQPKQIDWRNSFSRNARTPFGSYVLYDRLYDFPFEYVGENKESFYSYNHYEPYEGTESEDYSYTADSAVEIADTGISIENLVEKDSIIKEPQSSSLLNEDSSTASNNTIDTSTDIQQDLDTIQYTEEELDFNNSSSAYLIITDNFEPSEADINEILTYISRDGNSVFISSLSFSTQFLDTLNIESAPDYNLYADIDSGAKSIMYLNNNLQPFRFSNFPKIQNYFKSKNDNNLNTFFSLGNLVSPNQPNFIKITLGKGELYLHHSPHVFTNLVMLDSTNRPYIANCFSYLTPKNSTLTWDEYYKPNKIANEAQTPLRYILQQPGLSDAYYLGLLGIILFILFNVKRKQRAIPIVEPPKNASLEFADTVGSLYFRNGHHHDLAKKKVTYLLERLRSQYYLGAYATQGAFAAGLEAKTGCSNESAKELAAQVFAAQQRNFTSEFELIELHNAIEQFNNETGTYKIKNSQHPINNLKHGNRDN